jgi:elongator complex protein 3
MMPNLPESNPELDISSFNRVVEDSDFRPDELKIYPVIVTKHSELETLWREGKYKPYEDSVLIDLMATIQEKVPETMRINRIHRDIPSSEILAGCRIANLRQVVESTMKKRGKKPCDISAREVRAKTNDPENAIIDIIEYEANQGKEYFIQCSDPADRTLFGLLRLRIPSWFFTKEQALMPVLYNAALIREIHVFGDQLGIGEKSETKSQHRGLGKRLMETAETIVAKQYPTLSKIVVTSGVGVREYYRKRGYVLEDEYMVKYLLSKTQLNKTPIDIGVV